MVFICDAIVTADKFLKIYLLTNHKSIIYKNEKKYKKNTKKIAYTSLIGNF